MAKQQKQELQRDLGLWSVVAIAMGAMIGSGIFVLPGVAMAQAGPGVIVAFLIAAILVVPAAISIAELGTAMPEAGGDYTFIEQGMGPGAGTIAGLGTWLMLMFKGALALLGGMWYLTAIGVPETVTLWELGTVSILKVVGVVIGMFLIAVNIFGVKLTGALQTVMVVVMVAILAIFVAVGMFHIDAANYDGFWTPDPGSGQTGQGGLLGLLTATTMVLVSYAGVTKVAAVAEEIENPSRNLPLGLLLSLGVTTVLYVVIVTVLVGIVDAGVLLEDRYVPMATAVGALFSHSVAMWGAVILIVVAAMLALVSTANAGVLTASRYPFALSRDKLIPAFFGDVHDRFHTPVTAILITGGAMLAIILFLPVEDIAKMAGSFQIIVYILVNMALITFRVADPQWYKPIFKSPAYPWLQLFGVASGVGILTQMDLGPLLGGVGIIVVGSLWYLYYGKPRVEREGIVGQALATTMKVEPTMERPYRVVVPVSRVEALPGLIRVAAASASPYPHAELIGVNVVTVPYQTSLSQEISGEAERIEEQERLLERAVELAQQMGIAMRTHAIVGRDVAHAVTSVIDDEKADEVVLGWKGHRHKRDYVLGSIIDPIVEEANCEVTIAKIRHDKAGKTVAFITDGPYAEVTVIRAAELVSRDPEATLTLATVMRPEEGVSEEKLRRRGREIVERDVARVDIIDVGDYDVEVVIDDDVERALVSMAESFQTVCIGATRSSRLERALFGDIPEAVGEQAPGNVVIVRGEARVRRSLWEAVRQKFGSDGSKAGDDDE